MKTKPLYWVMVQSYLIMCPSAKGLRFDLSDDNGHGMCFDDYSTAKDKWEEIARKFECIVRELSGEQVHAEIDKDDPQTFNIVSRSIWAKITLVTLFDNM